MQNPTEMKLMTPPAPKPGKDAVAQSHYLIQQADDATFLIHRELDADEQTQYPPGEQFERDGIVFLRNVGDAETERAAELVVESLWRGIERLNDLLM